MSATHAMFAADLRPQDTGCFLDVSKSVGGWLVSVHHAPHKVVLEFEDGVTVETPRDTLCAMDDWSWERIWQQDADRRPMLQEAATHHRFRLATYQQLTRGELWDGA